MALKKRNPNGRGGLEYNSKRMANIVRDYHSELQKEGKPFEAPREEREKEMEEAIASLDAALAEDEISALEQRITPVEVRHAIYDASLEKAAGMDRIPIEVWRILTTHPKDIAEGEDPNEIMDAAMLLGAAFNDIVEYGMAKELSFAEGWMSPLFKKKDKTHIENYCPITVLNTDYKTMTSILTKHIAQPALHLIHEDQAGFMRGHRIEDKTDLIRTMINFCEIKDEHGLLVFLDQEKAYDKIMHNFLYKTLEKMRFPDRFTRAIKSLYSMASMQVIINGMISEPFEITRGVRQGDPLSCLLFNLTIESLASMIRKSTLKGFEIPSARE